jgi:hypothetical protein
MDIINAAYSYFDLIAFQNFFYSVYAILKLSHSL